MGKTADFEKIITVVNGSRIPVYFRNRGYSTIRMSYYGQRDNIISAEGESICIGNLGSGDNILPYMTAEQQEIWSQYSEHLFSILHEIGHIHSAKGLNWTVDNKAKKELHVKFRTQDTVNRAYRQLDSESRADAWATEWVQNNTDMAKEFDKMIRKYYNTPMGANPLK